MTNGIIIVSWTASSKPLQAYHHRCYAGVAISGQVVREIAIENLRKKYKCSKCCGWIRPNFVDRSTEINRSSCTILSVAELEVGMIFLYLNTWLLVKMVKAHSLSDNLSFNLKVMSNGDEMENVAIEKCEEVLVSEIKG